VCCCCCCAAAPAAFVLLLLLLLLLPGNALEALPEGLFSLPKLHTLNVSRNKVGNDTCCTKQFMCYV
jgi:hypothetical protein